jgi:glucose-6-phosphate 1-dehydrogenase
MQNHMMQVLGMVGMEPPGIAPSEVGARRLEFLRAVAEPSPDDVLSGTRRARYTAGRLADTGGADGRLVPDYAEEEGVDQSRDTETLAEVVLRVDNPRWSGTRFRLRAGKALSERRKGVVVRFRPTDAAVAGNELWLGVDGPNDVRLGLFGGAGAPFTLSGSPQAPDLSPYAHVLLDLFEGGDDLSVGGDEAEEAWRILTPVLEAWAAGRVPMEEYAAGSNGAWSQSPT